VQIVQTAQERAKMLSPEEEDEAAAPVAPVVTSFWCFDQIRRSFSVASCTGSQPEPKRPVTKSVPYD